MKSLSYFSHQHFFQICFLCWLAKLLRSTKKLCILCKLCLLAKHLHSLAKVLHSPKKFYFHLHKHWNIVFHHIISPYYHLVSNHNIQSIEMFPPISFFFHHALHTYPLKSIRFGKTCGWIDCFGQNLIFK